MKKSTFSLNELWQGILQERQLTEEVPAIQFFCRSVKIEIFFAYSLLHSPLLIQAVKVPIHVSGFSLRSPTNKATPFKALLRAISLSEYSSEGFRVRLRRLSEYGSVAYLVERLTQETQAEQYLDTVSSCSVTRMFKLCERSDPLQHSKSHFFLSSKFIQNLTIVCQGCSQGGWNLSNICQNLAKIIIFNSWTNF